MEITTQFSIGDTAWSTLNGQAHSFKITGIDLRAGAAGTVLVIYRDGSYNQYPDSICFATKEELVEFFAAGE